MDPKDLSALQRTSKRTHRFVENAQKPYQKFAKDIRDGFSVLSNESMNLAQDQDFVKNLYQTYPKNTADIILGCLHLAAGKFDTGMDLFEGKTLPKSLQERLNRAAYSGTLGFTKNINLPWFFEFYNAVQSMGKVPVKNNEIIENNENQIIENNNK